MDFGIEKIRDKASEEKKRRGLFFIIATLVFIVLIVLMSLILFLFSYSSENYLSARNDQTNYSITENENIVAITEENPQTNISGKENIMTYATNDWIPSSNYETRTITDYDQKEVLQNDIEKYRVENQNFTIIIPKLELEAPIVSGIEGFQSVNTTETENKFGDRVQKALEEGTLHYPGSSLPNDERLDSNRNIVILGHSSSVAFGPGSYKDIFSELRQMAVDDLIMIHYQGIEYTYKIYDKKIINPTEIEVLGPIIIDNNLTVITCHPPGDNNHRLVVLAQQITPKPNNSYAYSVSESIPRKNNLNMETITRSAPSTTNANLVNIPIDF